MLCIIGVRDGRQGGEKCYTILEGGIWRFDCCICDGDRAQRTVWRVRGIMGVRERQRYERRVVLDLSCLICTEKPRGESWVTIVNVTKEEE